MESAFQKICSPLDIGCRHDLFILFWSGKFLIFKYLLRINTGFGSHLDGADHTRYMEKIMVS